jgi:glycosidase
MPNLLNFYRNLLRIRRETPALLAGVYKPIHETAVDYLAYLRQLEEQGSCIVVLNFSDKSHHLDFSSAAPAAKCVTSTHKSPGAMHNLAKTPLSPFEVFIGECVHQI